METETGSKERETRLKTARVFALLIVLSFIAILMSSAAEAAIWDAFGRIGSSISGGVGGFFGSYANAQGPTFLDVIVFAIIFVVLCYVAFTNVFKDAKQANVVLALALGIALSLGLVFGGNFTLKKLFPFAGVILFLLIFIGIYALLKKFVFTKDTTFSKIISAVIAIIVAAALIFALFSMVCSDRSCESNPILGKIFGHSSIFGNLLERFDGLFKGLPPPPANRPLTPAVIARCGDGEKQGNEVCDPGGRPGVARTAEGCDDGELCDNCRRCIPGSGWDAFIDGAGNNWKLISLVIVLLIVGSALVVKRKNIADSFRKWRHDRKHGKKRESVETVLRDIEKEESEMLNHFRALCDSVHKERDTFRSEKELMERLATDIKDTIGGEIELIQSATAQPGGNIHDHIHNLMGFNEVTQQHIIGLIINEIDSQLNKLNNIPAELEKELKEIRNVHELFDEHSSILDSFQQFEFGEKDFISGIIKQIQDNKDRFDEMRDGCRRMVQILGNMMADVQTIAGRKDDYHEILGHLKDLRLNSQKLNKLFAWKVSMLKYMVTKMKETQTTIHQIHQEECRNLKESFLAQAGSAMENGNFDTAVYLASHVIEAGRELIRKEMAPEDKEELVNVIRAARGIIQSSIPKVFDSMKPRIRDEIQKREFTKLKLFAEKMERIDFVSKDHGSDFAALVSDYNAKMQKLKLLAEKLETGQHIHNGLWRLIQ